MQRYTSAGLLKPNGRVLPADIPLEHHSINRLTQVRRSMRQDEVDSLARKILATGQLSRGRLAALTPAEAKAYLDEINLMWSSSHKLRSMKMCEIDGNRYYLFVVFGHRRLLACERAKHMITHEGAPCDHFDGSYLCDIYFGLTAREAIVMQLGENTYVKPSIREEMDALWRLWRFMKREDETISVARFARIVGRRPERIKEMLRFTALPESIQARIAPDHPKGSLPYQLVLQHARLAEAYEEYGRPMTPQELELSLDLLVLRRVTVDNYRKEVTARIFALAGEQDDLFGACRVSLPSRRKVVGEQVIRAVLSDVAYLELVHRLFREGRIGERHPLGCSDKEECYSPYSPARLVERLLSLLEQVAPEIAAELRKEGRPMTSLEAAEDRLVQPREVFATVTRDQAS